MESLCPFDRSLVTSNAIPEDEDVNRIQRVCAELSQDLSRMNAQIERLRASLDAITQTRDALHSRFSSLKSITSPLRKFPVEVLQLIFINCLEQFSTISTTESPLVLTQICSRWRSIAIDTPELWTAIHINIPQAYAFEPYSSKCNSIREGVQKFLMRSGHLPLSISLYSSNNNTNQEDISEVTRTLEILEPYHKRWKHLYLQIPLRCMVVVEHLRGEDLPILETTLICCSQVLGADIQNVTEHSVPFFENAPCLRQLSLGAWYGATIFKPTGAATWERITHLIVGTGCWRLHLRDIIDMLVMCFNLEECTITVPSNDFSTSDAIPLPKLRRMNLDGQYNESSAQLLDLLILPELRELTVIDVMRDHNSPLIQSIENLLRRSSCPLTRFRLRSGVSPNASPSPESMSALFKSMLDLNELILSDGPLMTEGLLSAFTVVSPISEVLCPKLTRIEFEDDFAFPEDALLSFLTARLSPPTLSGVAPLSQVSIKHARPFISSRFSELGESKQLVTSWSFKYRRQGSQGSGSCKPSSRELEGAAFG
ncbi:hypothetical protein K435DRAFT_709224 [Dendrothele bispora CBS 962.96]|uniref:Uncharacterized protein n=1 Tax=Dendrothele bispora (strain CBS 962.96) TaxID=1314807 RepID=A0A4S8MX89_DENBC|nr:hypothetical protein K435DRAFT_709224 [Dendrothele bispora CBS 962.96]